MSNSQWITIITRSLFCKLNLKKRIAREGLKNDLIAWLEDDDMRKSRNRPKPSNSVDRPQERNKSEETRLMDLSEEALEALCHDSYIPLDTDFNGG